MAVFVILCSVYEPGYGKSARSAGAPPLFPDVAPSGAASIVQHPARSTQVLNTTSLTPMPRSEPVAQRSLGSREARRRWPLPTTSPRALLQRAVSLTLRLTRSQRRRMD